MRIRLGVAALLAATVTARLSSQTVIESPKSTIELVGLHRWTLQMIEDSLAIYSPKDSLTAHACAAILRQKLHFADASVTMYTGFDKSRTKPYVAITIVEPADSALIHYKPAFRDSLPTRAEWSAAWAAFYASNELAQTAIQTESFYAPRLSPADSVKFAKVEAIHALIVSQRDVRAFDQALRSLETDGNVANRAMALLVIGNFADRDSAWWALADALRDPQGGMVNGTASMLLRVLTRRSARPVDWRPMADRLRYIVDGTNLFGLNQLMTTLSRTAVDPSLAPALLGGGGAIVRAKLHSGDADARHTTIAFLSQLSGLPAVSDAGVFDRWMRDLH